MRSPEVTDEDQARMAPDRTLGWSQQTTRFGGFFVAWDSGPSRGAGEGMAKGLHGLMSPGHIASPAGCVIYLHQRRRMRSPEVTDEDQARMAPDRMLGWSQQKTRFGGFFVAWNSGRAGVLAKVWQKAYTDWCHLAMSRARQAA
jgi:hypothetical protein